MSRFILIRRALAAALILAVAVPVAAQHAEHSFTNLKVLPKDISDQELHQVMSGFTRGLGVRCNYCHALPEGQQPKPSDFASDDKPTKLKARVMMQMTKDINDKYLTTLEHRADPPVGVQCVTCHHGAAQPRTLQDVLKTAYDKGGVDSTLARYQSLRDRYYGRATYDFGDASLADLGGQLRDGGHADDGMRLLSYNIEMNPTSMFAKRQYAWSALMQAFRTSAVDSGVVTYNALKSRFGEALISEQFTSGIAYELLNSDQVEPAIGLFKVIVADHPQSGNAYDSLGEAYAKHGDKKLAIDSYSKSLMLDPANTNAKEKIEELKHPSKAKPKSGK